MLASSISSHYATHINLLFEIFLVVGVIACAISGALRAIESHMDITGAILLAFVISNAGGTMRDLILNTQVFWIKQTFYIWLSIAIGFATYSLCYFKPLLVSSRRLSSLVITTDAIGLGVFCLVGVEKSIALGQSNLVAIVMGILTAIGGGVLADVIANRVPLVFSSELYITVSFCGAILYLILNLFLPQSLAGFIAVIFMILLRMLSVRKHWTFPIIKNRYP